MRTNGPIKRKIVLKSFDSPRKRNASRRRTGWISRLLSLPWWYTICSTASDYSNGLEENCMTVNFLQFHCFPGLFLGTVKMWQIQFFSMVHLCTTVTQVYFVGKLKWNIILEFIKSVLWCIYSKTMVVSQRILYFFVCGIIKIVFLPTWYCKYQIYPHNFIASIFCWNSDDFMVIFLFKKSVDNPKFFTEYTFSKIIFFMIINIGTISSIFWTDWKYETLLIISILQFNSLYDKGLRIIPFL